MIPAAALAAIRAAVEDAQHDGHNDPAHVAQRTADALTAQGWTIAAHPRTIAPQKATRPFTAH